MKTHITELSSNDSNKILQHHDIDPTGMYRKEKLSTLNSLGYTFLYSAPEYAPNTVTRSCQTSKVLSSMIPNVVTKGSSSVIHEPFATDAKYTDLIVQNNVTIDGSLNVAGRIINNTYITLVDKTELPLKSTDNYSLIICEVSGASINFTCPTISDINYFKTGNMFFKFSLQCTVNFDSNFVVAGNSGLNNNTAIFPAGNFTASFSIIDNKVYINFYNTISDSTSLSDLVDGPQGSPTDGDTIVWNDSSGRLAYQNFSATEYTSGFGSLVLDNTKTNHLITLSSEVSLTISSFVPSSNEGSIIIITGTSNVELYLPGFWYISGLKTLISNTTYTLRYLYINSIMYLYFA